MKYKVLLASILMALGVQSCADPSRPNYQYFPNMYEPVGYETYADSDAFANGIEAQIPVEGSIARGWEPYDYPDTNEGCFWCGSKPSQSRPSLRASWVNSWKNCSGTYV